MGAAGAALLQNAGCSMDETGAGGPMNVLLLIIDSLRPDHVGAYGASYVQTPNVDRIASRGLTGKVAEEEGRQWLTFELDPEYVEASKFRWNEFSS